MLPQRLIGRGILGLLHQLGYALGFLLLFVVVERLAIFLNPAPDGVAVDIELLKLLGLRLLHLAVGVDVLGSL